MRVLQRADVCVVAGGIVGLAIAVEPIAGVVGDCHTDALVGPAGPSCFVASTRGPKAPV